MAALLSQIDQLQHVDHVLSALLNQLWPITLADRTSAVVPTALRVGWESQLQRGQQVSCSITGLTYFLMFPHQGKKALNSKDMASHVRTHRQYEGNQLPLASFAVIFD